MQKREFLKGGLAALGMLGCGAAAAKAAGEGNIAALSACEYVKENK